MNAIKDRVVELTRIKASDLVPHEGNWRLHLDSQRKAMEAAFAELGNADALKVRQLEDGTYQILDGHLRADISGDQEIPCLVLDLDDEEARKLLISFDPIGAMAGTDDESLTALITSVHANDEAFGALLDSLKPDVPIVDDGQADAAGAEAIDKAEQLLGKWPVEVGQLWTIQSKSCHGSHRLVCGDASDTETVARAAGDLQAVMLATDAPYGVDFAGVKDGIPRSGFRDIKARGGDVKNDDLSYDQLQALLESVLRTALPHLTDNPAFYLWHPQKTIGAFFAAAAAAAADILIHRQIVWVKPHMVLTRSGQYHWRHECCFYGWIEGKPCPWYGDKSQTSVWELEPPRDRLHPTQKPVELFELPIRNHTRPGEAVYEPFAGGGTQFVAAERSGRLCFGVEIEPKYCSVTLERLAMLGLEPKLASDANA